MPSFFSRIRSAWRVLRGRGRFESDMDAEFHAHMALRAADLERSGLAPDDALRRARVEFGSVERYKEEGRESRGVRLLDELRADVRLAWRSLRRSPGFALALILTLALGIGANSAIFSVVDAVLLRPLPFAGAERLVVVWGTDRASGTTREPNSFPDFSDVRERSQTLSVCALGARSRRPRMRPMRNASRNSAKVSGERASARTRLSSAHRSIWTACRTPLSALFLTMRRSASTR